jgi:hypothetical protein
VAPALGEIRRLETPEYYFWAEAFEIQIKICGRIPDPEPLAILERDDTVALWTFSTGI